jgi:hypothetical protein
MQTPDLALIVGHGINLFNSQARKSQWKDLLRKLWFQVYRHPLHEVPMGISLPEFYDLLELELASTDQDLNLQKEFCDLLSAFHSGPHHESIIDFAKAKQIPILTTNFDSLLARAGQLQFQRFRQFLFTDFYPWGCYYSDRKLTSPLGGFAVWHINGMEKYHRSLRLGLTHYMGSVQKARELIHKDREEIPFTGKNVTNWRGYYTWLHLIFNRSLLIFGLGLEETEVFLRWVLIERAKYFNRWPRRRKNAWYLCLEGSDNPGKKLFLEHLGIEYVEVEDYSVIYEDLWA